MDLSFSVSPRRTFLALVFVIGGLVAASTVAGAAWFFLGLGDSWFLIVQMFWVDSEANIPTLYSSITLLVSALLLGTIAIAKRREGAPYALHWAAMALVFVYLGFDEGARIHERTVEPLRALLGDSFLPTNAFFDVGPTWVVLGGLFVLVFFVSYLRFLLHLPARIRNLMVLSGAIYVGGALGFEVLSGMHAVVHGQENATYALLTTVEEFLEMMGIAIFIYTLLSYLGSLSPRIEVRIGPS